MTKQEQEVMDLLLSIIDSVSNGDHKQQTYTWQNRVREAKEKVKNLKKRKL